MLWTFVCAWLVAVAENFIVVSCVIIIALWLSDLKRIKNDIVIIKEAYVRASLFFGWRRGKWTSCLHRWTFDDRLQSRNAAVVVSDDWPDSRKLSQIVLIISEREAKKEYEIKLKQI